MRMKGGTRRLENEERKREGVIRKEEDANTIRHRCKTYGAVAGSNGVAPKSARLKCILNHNGPSTGGQRVGAEHYSTDDTLK